MFPPFSLLNDTAAQQRSELFGNILGSYANLLDTQEIIRVYVASTPGYGHQSSSINILRRLVGTPDGPWMGFNYSRNVEIIYDNLDDNGDSTLAKIHSLLPELAGNNQGNLSNANIKIIEILNGGSPKDKINFAFCGGYDTVNENLTKEWNVAYAIILQPYNYSIEFFAKDLAPGNLLKIRTPENKEININLDKGNLAPFKLQSRAFYVPTIVPTRADWAYFTSGNFPIEVTQKVEAIKTLTDERVTAQIDITPVYGINYPGASAFAKPIPDRIFLEMAAIRTSLENPSSIAKPPIIVNFGKYVPGTDAFVNFKYIKYLLEGGYTISEQATRLLSISNPGDLPQANEWARRKALATSRINAVKFPNIDTQYLFVDFLKDQVIIEELITWVTAAPKRVLFIQMGFVPPLIFNYFLSKAKNPSLFEGPNTAVVAINTGKPYFNTNRPGDHSILYPTGYLGNTNITEPVRMLQEIADKIEVNIDDWPPLVANAPTSIMGDFIFKTRNGLNNVKKYFGSIKEFYSLPGSGSLYNFNEKLDVGLTLVAALQSKQLNTFDLLAQEGKLIELFNLLEAAAKSGSINLLEIFPEGNINDFYTQLLKDFGNGLIIDNPILSKVTGSEGNLTGVLLTGETNAFKLKTASNFKFSIFAGDIFSSGKFTAQSPWNLDDIPWIVFESPFVRIDASQAELPPNSAIGGKVKGTDFELSMNFPIAEDGNIVITGEFEKAETISDFFGILGGINIESFLPKPIQALGGIGVKSLEFAYNTKTKTISYISVKVVTTSPWNFFNTLNLTDIALNITVVDPIKVATRKTIGDFSGNLKFGNVPTSPAIKLGGSVPDLTLQGQLATPKLPINDVINVFWPGLEPGWPGGNDPAITDFNFFYQLSTKAYSVALGLQLDWPIHVPGISKPILEINSIGMSLDGTQASSTGSLNGSITIFPETQKIGFSMVADYLGKGNGWKFMAQQNKQPIKLLDLIGEFLPQGWMPEGDHAKTFDIDITGLGLTVETKTNSWSFTGKTDVKINIPGTGIEAELDLKLGYNGGTVNPDMGGRETIIGLAEIPVLHEDGTIVPLTTLVDPVAPEAGYFGTVSANIKWEFIDITVYYDFKPDYQAFGIKWGLLEGKIVTTEDKKTKKKTSIATLGFTKSTTLGGIVETMISWATGSKFGLTSPWSILNSIPLNNLALVYNLTTKQVSFNIDIGPIELGIAKIKALNVAYKSKQKDPADDGVQVELIGSFRWMKDGATLPPWNAAKPETTPAPEGQGNKYLDLRLLALGQHVTYPGFADVNSVQEAIKLMGNNLKEPNPDKLSIPDVTLDANSSWLIGMDFGVLRFGPDDKKGGDGGGTALYQMQEDPKTESGYFITMQIIFNDPNLYALRIKLDGDAAKVLKGLDFQILYKKISDSIGMYKAEIALPDAMRFIKMGQYNITLPIFGIEYYTNGDFQVDVGFPWKADFTRSLTFQTLIWTPIGIPIPVMGSLGVYFGKLSSATTDKVPKIINGNFNPVLVFGFGIQMGIGYEFSLGILKAGFSLTAVAIVEGVIAKFNPYPALNSNGVVPQNTQVESSYYFWLKGTVGIIGKLYGTIDFAIIKANVNIDIRILASFTFAPYEPILLNLMASVVIEVSVSINLGLFKIKISFSFSAKISATVTITAIGSNPPWEVAEGNTPYYVARRRNRVRALINHNEFMTMVTNTTVNWNNLKAATTKAPLQGYMTLGLTMAGDIASQVSEQIACYVAMMFIDSVKPPQEDRTSGIEKAYGTTADTSFEVLAKTILRWGVAAIQPAPLTSTEVDALVVNAIQLKLLLQSLDNPKVPLPIPGASLDAFLAGQFAFSVEGPTTDKEPNATYFPIAPAMTLTIPKYGTDYDGYNYAFSDYNKTSSDYLKFLRNYFNDLAVKVQKESPDNINSFDLSNAESDSLGSFIFNDYFLMIARQMLQSAIDSLQEFKYYIQDGQSPNQIVKWINTNGQFTNDDIYTLLELFTDNDSAPLNAGKKLTITGATYVVQSNDTFDSIAENKIFAGGFTGKELAIANSTIQNTLTQNITIAYPKPPDNLITLYKTQPSQSLEQIAKELEIDLLTLISNTKITSLANLPLPVATFKIPSFTYTTENGDTLQGIAAKFRIDLEQLAIDTNGDQIDLFNKTNQPALEIANLSQFNVGELIKEIQATQGLQHLSGMTSRYYMAGLRLPTSGITPQQKGMWVTGEAPDLKLPDFAGLYALTGQQFPLPQLNDTDDFNADFGTGGIPWLSFVNADPAKLQISVKPKTNDAKQVQLVTEFATKTRLDTGLSFLGLKGMFNTKEATYSINSEINWNAASAFSLPVGGAPTGIPNMQLWQLPDVLTALPDLNKRKINPRLAVKLGNYNEAARALVSQDLNYYGYASLVEFTVKKVPVVSNSPSTKTTYEVMGADGKTAKVLERIVSEIGTNNEAIQTLILAYPSNPNSTTSKGIQTDDPNALTMGLAQVNLSTITRPDAAFNIDLLLAKGGVEGMVLLNEKTDFVRLLWEASIIRTGGYFLYYYNEENSGGLPDAIFNDKGEAQLSMVVVYSQPADVNLQNTVGAYMNALVTGQKIDRKKSVLFAEADPVKGRTVLSSSDQTMADLAFSYFGNVSQIASDNSTSLLRPGLNISIPEGSYEVGPTKPAGDLQLIADHFGVSPEAIKNANPKVKSWPNPLPKYTALYLPKIAIEIAFEIGNEKGGTTLGDLAKYYGMNLTALANHNKDIKGIFADGQNIAISGGPVITASTVPQGNVNIEAIRPKPAAIPDAPAGAGYGKIYLQNLYSLLSYQVVKNPYFSASNLGLPASPTTKKENAQNVSKVQTPMVTKVGDNWYFRQSVPYNKLSIQTPELLVDMPDQKDSPYHGLGDLLQVDFAWQDFYGNRLYTNLTNPVTGDPSPLNQPIILTGYSDQLIGLKKWPSVASTYEIGKAGNIPNINLLLTFSPDAYQGLMSATAKSATTINVVFTEKLDPASASNIVNYTLNHNIKIASAVLGEEGITVTLTVDSIPQNEEIILSIANISNVAKSTSSQGVASFYDPTAGGEPSSTLLQKAKGDLETYTQLWYQLTDPYGIEYTVKTSLLSNDFTLDTKQVTSLVQEWVASIWKYINDRAHGLTEVKAPNNLHTVSFDIDTKNLNPSELYQLDLSFNIERTGGSIMGDLETTDGIQLTTTEISPFAGSAGGATSNLLEFSKNFEGKLSKPNAYKLKIATGINREEPLVGTNGNELWVVRLGTDKKTSIGYQIKDKDNPQLFAPRPITTKLQNRKNVPIWEFDPKTGIDFEGRPSMFKDFTGIDMDNWGRQFFEAIDGNLSSEYTAAVQLVDHNQIVDHNHSSAYLQEMLDNKKKLAGIIQEWMTFVFTDGSGSLTTIREAFRQQLLVKLGNAYTVKAGIQYSAKVEAGPFKLFFVGLDPDNANRLIVRFTSDIDSTVATTLSNYTISDGLTVTAATLNVDNPQLVNISLSGVPVVGRTIVTINKDYTDFAGNKICANSTKMVGYGNAATPELYGNFSQNFKFIGAAINPDIKTNIYVYFSGVLEKTAAETAANYQVSGVNVNSAILDQDSLQIVTLALSAQPKLGAEVSITGAIANLAGQSAMPPLNQKLQKEIDISHLAKGISFTAAKLNLKNSDNVPLPFLVSAPQLVRDESGAILPYIDLDTSFESNAVEHQIGNLPNIGEYRASTWLSFANKSKTLDSDLGRTKVPMILRSFPAVPTMVNQTGKTFRDKVQKSQSEVDINNILEWSYFINYSQTTHYPQDQLDFVVNFNVMDKPKSTDSNFEDAFNQLAQFITIYPEVEKVFLQQLIQITAATTDENLFKDSAIALGAYNTMISMVIDAAEGNGLRMSDFAVIRVSNEVDPYVFSLQEEVGTVNNEKAALIISITGKPPVGVGNPSVIIEGYDTKILSEASEDVFRFYFEDATTSRILPASQGQSIGPRSIKIPEMNLLARQDAETTVELKRNVGLVPDKTTTSDFEYSTGSIGYQNPYHPVASYGGLINIATISGKELEQSLQQHLTTMFDILLKENSQPTVSILMTNTFNYQINTALENIELPVMMQPLQSFNVKKLTKADINKTLAEMIDSWAGYILEWMAVHNTSNLENASLNFNLTIFSNLTEVPTPLVHLDQLYLDLSMITDVNKELKNHTW
ncbi:LysM peptidoglycan-binding domain-containing protein [Changchengzhania lutea]|uniref:LysM peptidoglycan-binding domain-containing protein n=1 Tax=Changchengzhania lutea TaxID=2049305 RepID=UPI00115E3AFE|nr:LysM peptidoglycan-binding domain-containing protein [Changchengzhania lutea]